MDDVQQIATVREHGHYRYVLWLTHEDGDGPNAVGQLMRQELRPNADLLTILRTNDKLRALWVSPAGHLWVSGADGTIGTTAPVRWPAPTTPGVQYLPENGGPAWQVTSLPDRPGTRIPPSITTMWGTDDQHVWAGDDDGYLYVWDGVRWAVEPGIPLNGSGSIHAIVGTSATDIYVVGRQSTILHFNGQAWSRLTAPGLPNPNESFTGLLPLGDGQMLITGAGPGPVGRILQAGPGGVAEITKCDVAPRGVVALEGRYLMPVGAAGVAELTGRTVSVLKGSIDTVAATPGAGRVYFIESVQDAPSYIEYAPAEDPPWARIAH